MIRTVKTGATLLCLLVLLTGCAGAIPIPPIATTEDRVVEVPEVLTEPTPHPETRILAESNGDMADLALNEYPAALDSCNADKQSIRDFSDREAVNGAGQDQ